MDYMDEVIKMIDLSQAKPLNEIIYQGLRSAIISGVIPMGERINEKMYADALNVSRTPIREALRRIQDEDIVRYSPNLGIVITSFTKKDVEEIYKIRHSLEILAGTNAALLMTPEKEAIMQELLDKTRVAQEAGLVEEVIQLSKQFNSLIYDFAEMPRLKTIQHRLRDYLTRFRDISLKSESRREVALKEHEIIFECMKNKDLKLMEEIITNHLSHSKDFIIKELERQTHDK